MAAAVSKRPLIGIATRLNPTEDTNYLRQTYASVIYHSGGTPVLIPLLAEAAYVEALGSILDGIVLSGSDSDIDPFRYGQAAHVKLGKVYPERDETDRLLLAAAESHGLPVLAICFGLQSLNVFRGGTLLQDLPSQVENVIQHYQLGGLNRHAHGIQINRESMLAKLAGGATARVNSFHHQAIDELGDDLEPIAWAADGVIEAVVNTRPGQFILGVQWHPEVDWRHDEFSQAIFKRFLAETALRA